MIDDLRDFLRILEERGKLKTLNNAHWDLEIGTINELMAERQGPALVFDNITDYPEGFRVATNLLHHRAGQKLAFDFPEESTDVECVREWKDMWNKFQPVPPVIVEDAPIKDNILKGSDVDVLRRIAPHPLCLDRDGFGLDLLDKVVTPHSAGAVRIRLPSPAGKFVCQNRVSLDVHNSGPFV